MWILPRYHPVGNFVTGNLGDPFYLFANDAYDASGQIHMYYDSTQIFPHPGLWIPEYLRHNLWHSLANTRAKINPMETLTPSFQKAVELGTNHQEYIGTPSFMIIPQTLRTWQGGPTSVGGTTYSKGRFSEKPGGDAVSPIESSPVTGQTPRDTFIGDGPTTTGWQNAQQNAQRWHFRHSLPRTTQLLFDVGDNLTKGRFEGRTADQYLGISFVFRTNAKNGKWDLSTFAGSTNQPDWPQPDNRHVTGDDGDVVPPNLPDDTRNRDRFNRFPTRHWLRGRGHKPPYEIHEPYDTPQTPIVIVDYSNPSATDLTTIGTH